MTKISVEQHVSRETFEDLCTFVELVSLWSPKINLVSRSSLDLVWDRHISDALQLSRWLGEPHHWVDLGSGGGFPGLVVGIVAKHHAPATTLTLIESDKRKSVFLRTAIRKLGLNATVLTDRIESAAPQGADIVSARALADLSSLLGFSRRHLKPTGKALFQKGASWEKEVADARREWSFDLDVSQSTTNEDAVILSIGNVEYV